MVINVIYLAVSDSLLPNLSPVLLVLTKDNSPVQSGEGWKPGHLACPRTPVHACALLLTLKAAGLEGAVRQEGMKGYCLASRLSTTPALVDVSHFPLPQWWPGLPRGGLCEMTSANIPDNRKQPL